jgi:hypothetical protein
MTKNQDIFRSAGDPIMQEFDEAFYLDANPDVAEAVRRHEWPSGFSHYCVIGKKTGRVGAKPVDSDWYVHTYPQAASDIAAGRAACATEHYHRFGKFRGYLPSKSERRQDNPAATLSRFGGLWTDVGNALDIISGRLDVGLITQEQAAILTKWVTDGYVVLPGAVPSAVLDGAEAELERAYRGEIPGLRFAVHGVGECCEWVPDALRQPAKALDIHWFSTAILNLIFTAEILAFLHLIFERRVLASQTLGFWRGSAQNAHQDSAYVNYSLPMQFAASWIALEDVREGAGELYYHVGSHRMPEFLYAREFKGAFEAKRVDSGLDLKADMSRHIELIGAQSSGAGLSTGRFLAKRGDILIWSADLAHGGRPISLAQTRKSVVTHYCPAESAPGYFEHRPVARIKPFGGAAFYTTAQYL